MLLQVQFVEMNVYIPEIRAALVTPTDEIQQPQLVENAESPNQAVRRSALVGR